MTTTAIVMACNAAYAPYALCLAEQIARDHPERSFDICIFSDEPLEVPDTLAPLGVKLISLEGENPFLDTPNFSRHGHSTYLRLLVPRQMAGRYRRILYLDSDIIATGGRLDRLLSVDLGGRAVGAVRDHQQWRRPYRQVSEFKSLSLPQGAYFNAGVLLVDVDRFNALGILSKAVDLMKRHPEALRRHDQSLLNLLLRGDWAELSPVWNWQYTAASRHITSLAEPHLLHFIGSRKPWLDTRAQLPASFRRVYRDFQIRHYPDRPELCPADPAPMAWPEKLASSLVRHALSAGKMRAYLSRFPDPYAAAD